MIGMTDRASMLMQAIAIHEGWRIPSPEYGPYGSRSSRNHNPGNLRKSPFASHYVDNFAVFKNDLIGYQALQWDLLQKARGNTSTGLKGSSTLSDLLYVWAPPTDNNNTEAYIEHVCALMNVPRSITLAEIFDL